jgi:hypothetical protein
MREAEIRGDIPDLLREVHMTDFAPAGYMTLEQAIDDIGRHLMPHEWLCHETDLLRRDSSVTENLAGVGEEAAATDTPVGRLNRALNHLLRALFAGEVKAVVVREHEDTYPCPPSLWNRPGIRAVFRSGELPVQFRVALEGHLTGEPGEGRRWIVVSKPDVRRLLGALAPGREVADVEAEFRTWLTAKVDESAGKEPPSKKRTWAEAQSAFGSRLAYKSFERVWAATVPAEWRRPARKPQPKPTA